MRMMRRCRAVGFCLAAAICMAAVLASSASALEAPEIGRCVAHAGGKFKNSICTKEASGTKPGKYEWEPGAVKKKFTGVGGTATLENVGQAKVTCKTEASNGEYASPKTVGNIAVVFTGCQSAGYSCATPGAAEGEIATNLLAGTLRWENTKKTKVAIDLVPQSTELFVEFQCGPLPAKVKGSVMTDIKTDKVETVFEEKFKATKGKQKPEYYYTNSGEKIQDILLAKLGGPGEEYEQSGQTITNKQTDEEPLELNRYF
jgi:hypothetical protein